MEENVASSSSEIRISDDEDEIILIKESDSRREKSENYVSTSYKINKSTNTDGEYESNTDNLAKAYQENFKKAEIEKYKRRISELYKGNHLLSVECQELKRSIERSLPNPKSILRKARSYANPFQIGLVNAIFMSPDNKAMWTNEMRRMTMSLFDISPDAYRYLEKILLFPDESELIRWERFEMKCNPNQLKQIEDAENHAIVQNESEIQADEMVDEATAKRRKIVEDSSRILKAQETLDQIAFENFMSALV